jgi:hypothetical protein
MRHIERDLGGDVGLESRFAAQDSGGQRQQTCRVRPRQNQKRVDESIGFDEGTVEIDAQRPQNLEGCFRRRQDLGQHYLTADRRLSVRELANRSFACSSAVEIAQRVTREERLKYTVGLGRASRLMRNG